MFKKILLLILLILAGAALTSYRQRGYVDYCNYNLKRTTETLGYVLSEDKVIVFNLIPEDSKNAPDWRIAFGNQPFAPWIPIYDYRAGADFGLLQACRQAMDFYARDHGGDNLELQEKVRALVQKAIERGEVGQLEMQIYDLAMHFKPTTNPSIPPPSVPSPP